MAIQGINNSFFDLSSIRSIASSPASRRSSGAGFDLGGTTSTSNVDNIGNGDLGLGNVNPNDPQANRALNSVAAENALQQQFQNQLALISLQERIQSQSRTIEVLTNILKSRHDASMSAIRNVK
ncbi:MAG: hypothetical protein RMM17_03055 [Acidobacteriota bacterium]|nr:hypothetical protein [Blastocatellia bacterium]MDW8411647.1 hypothetical protein [Acidobacteriota bacterium]